MDDEFQVLALRSPGPEKTALGQGHHGGVMGQDTKGPVLSWKTSGLDFRLQQDFLRANDSKGEA